MKISIPEDKLDRYFAALCFFGCALLAVVFVVPTAVFDSYHFDDTIFLSNLGWRVYNGATPTVDFQDFLGGLTAETVGLAMALFGLTVKAVEYAFAIQWSAIMLLWAIVAWRRVDIAVAGVIALLLSSIVLTRAALEMSISLHEVQSAHSFFYNRVGTCLAISVGIFALSPSRTARHDIVVGTICGIALYALILTKPTFVLFWPAYFVALVVTGRWSGILGSVIGLAVSLLLIDFSAARFIAAADYAQMQMAQRVAPLELIKKMLRMLAIQSFATMTAMATLAAGFFLVGIRFLRPAIAIVSITGGGLVLGASMGWVGLVGHQLVPFLLITPLIVYLLLPESNDVVRTIALLAPFGVILPHAGNIVASS